MREEGIAEWVNTIDQKTDIAIFNNKWFLPFLDNEGVLLWHREKKREKIKENHIEDYAACHFGLFQTLTNIFFREIWHDVSSSI